MLTTILMALLTLLILSILVVVHEWGHFIAARKIGVFVEEFAIGMGPALFKHQGKETLFSIRALPLGGYCKMRGEVYDEEDDDATETIEKKEWDSDDPGSFANRTKGERLIILIAGAMMNIIFAYVLIVIILCANGSNPLAALGNGFIVLGKFAIAIYQSLYMLISGQLGLNDIAGPIGMVGMVQEYYSYGLITLMSFTALISVNLGVFNLLPIPALDGGQIFILLIEKIIGRDIDPKKAGIINFIGFAALMTFALVIAVNDVMRMVG